MKKTMKDKKEEQQINLQLICISCKKSVKSDVSIADFICDYCIRFNALEHSMIENIIKWEENVKSLHGHINDLTKENENAKLILNNV